MNAKMIYTTLCFVLIIHVTSAMYGLCSTDWFTDGCFDFNDECREMGGECYHPGVGDHGDGCVCLKAVKNPVDNKTEYKTLTKDHFQGKGQLQYNPLP